MLVLIRLRELSEGDSLVQRILDALGVVIRFDGSIDTPRRREFELEAAREYIERTRCVVLVDGVDELHPIVREQALKDIQKILLTSRRSRVVITCRTADYTFSLPNTSVLTLQPLSSGQIEEFANRWLGPREAVTFLEQIRRTPYAGAEVRPLTLSQLCAIYERLGTIPDQPRSIYRKIVRLMLQEWDEQRFVRRYSRYAKFGTDQKEDFLQAIAYELSAQVHRFSFTHSELEDAYLKVYERFSLPRGEVTQVAREIESHTGLVLEAGFDRFEFAHKSIQEYLTAEHLLRLPEVPTVIVDLPNETALAVALSANPTGHFLAVIDIVTSPEIVGLSSFVDPFLQRLDLERAEFPSSTELAIGILALYSTACFSPHHKRVSPPDSHPSQALSRFLTKEQNLIALRNLYNSSLVTLLHRGIYRWRLPESLARPRRPRTMSMLNQSEFLIDEYLTRVLT